MCVCVTVCLLTYTHICVEGLKENTLLQGLFAHEMGGSQIIRQYFPINVGRAHEAKQNKDNLPFSVVATSFGAARLSVGFKPSKIKYRHTLSCITKWTLVA